MRLQAIWEGVSPYQKLVLSMLLVFICAFAFTAVGGFLVNLLWDINLMQDAGALNNLADPNVIKAMKLLQVLSATGTFIIPCFLAGWLLSADTFSFLALRQKPSLFSLVAVAGLVVVSTPLINWLMIWNQQLVLPGFLKPLENWMIASEANAKNITEAFLKMATPMDFLINLVMIGLIPAVGEELLFRGLLQPLIKGVIKNALISILFTSILFSAMHLQFYGFLPRMVLGLILGYLLEWSGSLWLPMLLHFLNNGMAVLMAYFYPTINMDEVGTTAGNTWPLLVSSLLTLILMVGVQRKAGGTSSKSLKTE